MSTSIGPVVKVGGSLLDEQNVVRWLQGWLSRQDLAPAALIAGGGAWADAVRAADKRFALKEDAAHWLCISAMRLTAQLLREMLPNVTWTSDMASIRSPLGGPVILDVEGFLRQVEPIVEGTPLPHSWQATSDSIAARVATAIGATELVLLKSALPPRGVSMAQAAETGYVDRFFPTAAGRLARVRCVNLRNEGEPEVVWPVADGAG